MHHKSGYGYGQGNWSIPLLDRGQTKVFSWEKGLWEHQAGELVSVCPETKDKVLTIVFDSLSLPGRNEAVAFYPGEKWLCMGTNALRLLFPFYQVPRPQKWTFH